MKLYYPLVLFTIFTFTAYGQSIKTRSVAEDAEISIQDEKSVPVPTDSDVKARQQLIETAIELGDTAWVDRAIRSWFEKKWSRSFRRTLGDIVAGNNHAESDDPDFNSEAAKQWFTQLRALGSDVDPSYDMGGGYQYGDSCFPEGVYESVHSKVVRVSPHIDDRAWELAFQNLAATQRFALAKYQVGKMKYHSADEEVRRPIDLIATAVDYYLNEGDMRSALQALVKRHKEVVWSGGNGHKSQFPDEALRAQVEYLVDAILLMKDRPTFQSAFSSLTLEEKKVLRFFRNTTDNESRSAPLFVLAKLLENEFRRYFENDVHFDISGARIRSIFRRSLRKLFQVENLGAGDDLTIFPSAFDDMSPIVVCSATDLSLREVGETGIENGGPATRNFGPITFAVPQLSPDKTQASYLIWCGGQFYQLSAELKNSDDNVGKMKVPSQHNLKRVKAVNGFHIVAGMTLTDAIPKKLLQGLLLHFVTRGYLLEEDVSVENIAEEFKSSFSKAQLYVSIGEAVQPGEFQVSYRGGRKLSFRKIQEGSKGEELSIHLTIFTPPVVDDVAELKVGDMYTLNRDHFADLLIENYHYDNIAPTLYTLSCESKEVIPSWMNIARFCVEKDQSVFKTGAPLVLAADGGFGASDPEELSVFFFGVIESILSGDSIEKTKTKMSKYSGDDGHVVVEGKDVYDHAVRMVTNTDDEFLNEFDLSQARYEFRIIRLSADPETEKVY